MKLPNLIIIGVFKAATTSLFRYLSKHPDICGSERKEIHYFTPLVYGTGEELPGLKYYSDYFSCDEEKYRLEASPAYFYGGEKVISRMQEILPADHKVILMLREPTDRFVSYYRHIKSQYLIEDDFSIFVGKCLHEYSKNAEFEIGHYKNAVREGLYMDFLPIWKEYYGDDLKVLFFENLKENPLRSLLEISEWLELDGSSFKNQDFAVENKTISPKNSVLHKLALFVYQMGEPLLRNNGLKRLITDFYRKINHDNQAKIDIHLESLKKIQDTYKPYNAKLAEYLGELHDNWQVER